LATLGNKIMSQLSTKVKYQWNKNYSYLLLFLLAQVIFYYFFSSIFK